MSPVERPTPYPTPYCSARKVPVSAIIIHDTASRTAESALSWFGMAGRGDSGSSSHVIIDRDGTIWRVVGDDKVAWHAGKSELNGVSGCNAFSLGVELVDADDKATDPYPDAQFDAVVAWCAAACIKHSIPLNRIVGHCHVSPGRKVDPGAEFPWAKFLLAVARQIEASA